MTGDGTLTREAILGQACGLMKHLDFMSMSSSRSLS